MSSVNLFDLAVYDTALLPKDLTDNKLIQKHRVVPLVQRGQIYMLQTSNRPILIH